MEYKSIDKMNEVIEWLYDLKHYIKYDEQAEALDIAIESIHMQIPKPPFYTNNGTVTRCRNCGKRLHVNVKYEGKFCDKCGQKLKWSNDNGD